MPHENSVCTKSQGAPASRAFWMCIACTLFTAVTVGLMVYGIYAGKGGSRLLAMLGSTGFVALALLSGGMRHGYGRLIFLGLCFCWLGDYLGPIHFEAGVLMFGVAHLAFSSGFLLHGVSIKHAVRAIPPVIAATTFIVGWVVWHTPGAWALVAVYGLIIGSMVILSAGMIPAGRAGQIAFVAAVVFYVSDIFVARGHYVAPGRINSLGCYPLYYSACLLFGWSAARAASAESKANTKRE